MKTALIITGNLRSFEKCYENFEQLINKFDCDIFICMSNIQFDLHPYIKHELKFYSDCILSDELINSKLNICKNINNKIKKIIVLDKIEEDNDFINNYLHNFDNKKEWKGIDIFKQYKKIKRCVDYIKDYEYNNDIKYNYIIKSRFDIDININSLPLFPLLENTFYTIKYDNNKINDIICITDSINNFDIICNEISKHFFNNYADKNVYESIHSLLYFIFKINNFNIEQNIIANINRDYISCFDTNITLVTCYYNINRENWNKYSRSEEEYFLNAENILNKKNPIVIFTIDNYVNRCLKIRQKIDIHLIYTKIIIIPFEELMYYDKIEKIREIQNNNIHNISNEFKNCPEFCNPEYIIIINNKINFLNKVANINYFNSKIFQWIDFGLHKNLYDDDIFNEKYFSNIFFKKNKIRIVSFNKPKNIYDKISYYNEHNDTVASGMIGGDLNAINKLYNLCINEFDYLLNNNVMNQEQYIYYYLMCTNNDLFDYLLINNWDDLCSIYIKNNTNIAICMSGHTRTFNLCKDNIMNNIINPIIKSGCNVDIFNSTWNDNNYIENLNDLQNFCTDMNSENYDSKFFINNYSSNQYLKFPGLCCETTSSNASSCIYKIYNSFKLCAKYENNNNIKYDIIIRIRPDITYNNIIDIGNIKQSLLNNYIYMSYSHGKYTSVTKDIMDPYLYGNYDEMKLLMKTYNELTKFINKDIPHTVEGFLYEQIINNNIIINRFMSSFGIIRNNGEYFKLIN